MKRELSRITGWGPSRLRHADVALLCCLILLIVATWPSSAQSGERRPQIAIIIDDIGYRYREGFEALYLNADITFAVLPHSPHGRELAQKAHARGKEVLLHLPMESYGGHHLGPGGLTTQMNRGELIAELSHNLNSIPHIIGVSNHMGSRMGAMHEPISWIMHFMHTEHRGLFFVDSRTSPDSLIASTASGVGVPNLTRDVFLDHDSSLTAIRGQFAKLLQLAKRNGSALAIGHPYPTTLKVLEQNLDTIGKHGIDLVPVSKLLRRRASRHLETAILPTTSTDPAGRAPTT